MSRWTPCKRRDFIRKLRKLGFSGPLAVTRHQFMIFGTHRLALQSNQEYSVPQLRMMIHETQEILNREISLQEWRNL